MKELNEQNIRDISSDEDFNGEGSFVVITSEPDTLNDEECIDGWNHLTTPNDISDEIKSFSSKDSKTKFDSLSIHNKINILFQKQK